jgi:hypothetical protein
MKHRKGNKSLHEDLVKSLISTSTIESRSSELKHQQSIIFKKEEDDDGTIDEDKSAQPSRYFKSFIDSFVSGKKRLSETTNHNTQGLTSIKVFGS